ncbi:hypothetical protein PFISCL1PPCAC_5419 [Pristionchus fissidentatus]|uniref:Uncharacterized protein n=1 Tax=Pristionchus fissidentatus TaxID=1538716 RepID=A0AAV5V3F4_9BILA|nr:hypothetical protein PFISCL1PPCAC_5419 [Pristionchus fissidentatus]
MVEYKKVAVQEGIGTGEGRKGKGWGAILRSDDAIPLHVLYIIDRFLLLFLLLLQLNFAPIVAESHDGHVFHHFFGLLCELGPDFVQSLDKHAESVLTGGRISRVHPRVENSSLFSLHHSEEHKQIGHQLNVYRIPFVESIAAGSERLPAHSHILGRHQSNNFLQMETPIEEALHCTLSHNHRARSFQRHGHLSGQISVISVHNCIDDGRDEDHSTEESAHSELRARVPTSPSHLVRQFSDRLVEISSLPAPILRLLQIARERLIRVVLGLLRVDSEETTHR